MHESRGYDNMCQHLSLPLALFSLVCLYHALFRFLQALQLTLPCSVPGATAEPGCNLRPSTWCSSGLFALCCSGSDGLKLLLVLQHFSCSCTAVALSLAATNLLAMGSVCSRASADMPRELHTVVAAPCAKTMAARTMVASTEAAVSDLRHSHASSRSYL